MKKRTQPSRGSACNWIVGISFLIAGMSGCGTKNPPSTGSVSAHGAPISDIQRAVGLGTPTDGAIHKTSIQRVDDLDSSTAPGTGGGNYACAWAVNRIAKEASAYEVGGGLSTADMYDRLVAGRGTKVSVEDAPLGSVIISPTRWVNGIRKTGHVGILGKGDGSSRLIYSNSSGAANWKQNFTAGRWQSYYGGRGLVVAAYQIHEKP